MCLHKSLLVLEFFVCGLIGYNIIHIGLVEYYIIIVVITAYIVVVEFILNLSNHNQFSLSNVMG